MQVRVNVSLPPTLLKRVDDARGDVSRSRFLMRTLEKALAGTVPDAADVPRLHTRDVSPPVPSRAPSKPKVAKTQPEKPLDHLKSSGLLQPAKYVKRFNPQPKK